MYVINIDELDEEVMDDLGLSPDDLFDLYEWDPDIRFKDNKEIYFYMYNDKIIVSEHLTEEEEKKLIEFCEGQDRRVSPGWWNARLETEHWKYVSPNVMHTNWKKAYIAYRNWCGYVYSYFKRNEN